MDGEHTSSSPEQREAAEITGTHVRLLAGPGTGKTFTLTQRVHHLVRQLKIAASAILVVTFSRAAARELQKRAQDILGDNDTPRISTLHSFAFSQLRTNPDGQRFLPRGFHVADDWEERHIIRKDLQLLLCKKAKDIGRLFNQMSADWETLNADTQNWEKKFPNPGFIGAWNQHRKAYGYALRSELVYRLKKAIEQHPPFISAENRPKYLLVDEYQDLNRCDLAVINAVSAPGSGDTEVFCAGDDDQSIYGFRYAHPDGIRKFPSQYQPCKQAELSVCHRCSPAILKLALDVIKQDNRRTAKNLHSAKADRGDVVEILHFDNQAQEANTIARLCNNLVHFRDVLPGDIMILLRNDKNGAMSKPLLKAIQSVGLRASVGAKEKILDTSEGRQTLALLRLAVSERDDLAWRTFLQMRNGIGDKRIAKLYKRAVDNGQNFSQALQKSVEEKISEGNCDDVVVAAFLHAKRMINDIRDIAEQPQGLIAAIDKAIQRTVTSETEAKTILSHFQKIIDGDTHLESLKDVVGAASFFEDDDAHIINDAAVNILTMHKSKGLDAKVVIVIGAEDEIIPGAENTGDKIDEERRLLYVSLTRAKEYLFITYCRNRTGQQKHVRGKEKATQRGLSQFLRDLPISPKDGVEYLSTLD